MKIHRPIKANERKHLNAAGFARPAVASQPGFAARAYTSRTTAVNPSSIANAFNLPPIQEAVVPIAMAAFPGYDITVSPPEGTTWAEAKETDALRGIKRADKIVKSLEQIRWAFYDTIGFRHYLGNYSLATFDNWILPDAYYHLPAESFGKAPQAVSMDTDRYWRDPLLQGITQDRNDGSKHYYQTQKSIGDPTEIPPDELLHICWELPGNQSIIASILPTIDFWHFTRQCLGLSAQRQGVPNAVATFDLAAAQWFADNSDGTITNGLPTGIHDVMDEIVKSQSIGTAFNLPPGGKLEYPATSGLSPAQELDQYVERKLVLHLIPTHVLDTLGSALSKSSQPALDLFVILANGWREVIAKPFEAFYEKLLVEYNGFEDGTQVSFEWWPVVKEDINLAHARTIASLREGMITINEARAQAGISELDDAAIAALLDEKSRREGTFNAM